MLCCTALHARPPWLLLVCEAKLKHIGYLDLPLPCINVHNALPAICPLLLIQGPAPDHHLQQVACHCEQGDAGC